MGNDEFQGTATAHRLEVGFNYPWPWDKYGIYLGSGSPPGADPSLSKWVDTLKANLVTLQQLGITVVRIFLMGNLANWGTVQKREWNNGKDWWWDFTPPSQLDSLFKDQLDAMFAAFAASQMKVIPSLVDFGAACDVRNPDGRGMGVRCEIWKRFPTQKQFFDMVLEPFLDISMKHIDSIFAWELMNEPIWVTLPPSMFGKPLNSFVDRFLPASDMETFLKEGLQRIQARVTTVPDPANPGTQKQTHAFKSTVGHRFAWNLDQLPLFGTTWPSGDIRQFHYYPSTEQFLDRMDDTLPNSRQTRGAILGEFAAGPPVAAKHHKFWPEIPGESGLSTSDRMLRRLELIERKGYGLALIWPDLDGSAPGATDPLKLSAGAQDGVKRYLHK